LSRFARGFAQAAIRQDNRLASVAAPTVTDPACELLRNVWSGHVAMAFVITAEVINPGFQKVDHFHAIHTGNPNAFGFRSFGESCWVDDKETLAAGKSVLRWAFVVTGGFDKVDDKATAEQVACGVVRAGFVRRAVRQRECSR
jgi:hypothetical protein